MTDSEKAMVKAAIAAAVAASPLGLKASLAAAGLGALREGATRAALGLIRNPDDRLRDCLAAERAAVLDEVIPQIAKRVEDLNDSSADQTAMLGNMVAIFREWERAWSNAVDAKKRRLLMAALVNAFDREVYEEGLTATLFRIADKLDYGDIRTLRAVQDGGGLDRRIPEIGPYAGNQGALVRWHLERLRGHGLVHWDPGIERSESPTHDAVGSVVRRSDLGTALLEFLQTEGERAEPTSDA